MIARLTGAFLRGILVAILIATPSLILPTVTSETAQIVAFLAMCGFAITVLEYGSHYPCLFEFRAAAPFNRIRFGAVLLTVVLLSLVARHPTDPTALTAFITSVGGVVGTALDTTYSPVRLAVLLLPETAPLAAFALLRAAIGVAILVFLVSLGLFVVDLHRNTWPRRGEFNVWVNLPTFDPTRGGDVVTRLDRDGRINIGVGLVLPFLLPMLIGPETGLLGSLTLDRPHTMVWAIAIWATLPFSLIMRGLAMQRIATMITLRRTESTPTRAGLVPL